MTPLEELTTPPAPVPAGPQPAGPAAAPADQPLRLPVALFVAAFAFLLASFPARNGDLWAHLAAGRDLAHGQFAGHSGRGWLFDLPAYLIYSLMGGAGLAVAKAEVAAALAVVVLWLSRVGRSWWLPVVCTVLALLATGTRLLLQPATVSCLFMALAFWFASGRRGESGGRSPGRGLWPLLILFVLWANVDSWFVVGLVVVALVWLGQELAAGAGGVGFARRAAALAVLAAACLLNPAHVHAFVPPAELAWLGGSGGGRAVVSPFQTAYLTSLGFSSAGLAYYPLLVLGLLSFALTLPRWHWERFLPWAGLALLSATEARAVPFFAVVAGPVLAWNLHEFFAARAAELSVPRAAARALPALAVVLGLAFLACAWTGWLQAPPFEPRRWAVEAPPALKLGAEQFARWHREGRLGPDTLGLHLSRESADAFAWFCPEERGIYDPRLAAAVLGEGGPEDWDRPLRAAGVHHVIVYDPNRDRLTAALTHLLADPRRWPLLYQEGDLAVFGWRDPERPAASDPFRGWGPDLSRLAFRPAPDRRAPRQRPEGADQERHWWDAFRKPAPPRTIDRDDATLRLLQADALRRTVPERRLPAWQQAQSAGLVAAAAGWAGPAAALDARVRLEMIRPGLREPDAAGAPAAESPLTGMALAGMRAFADEQDDVPPGLVYLAIRSARRAVAADPDDALAHLALGTGYVMLLHCTRERAWGRYLPQLVQLRRAQAVYAFNRALALRPDLDRAHASLAALYEEMGYLDLTMRHQREYVRLTRLAGPPPGLGAARFREGLAQLEQRQAALEKAVAELESKFSAEAAGVRVYDRAEVAMRSKLGGKALDILLASDVSAFGAPGMALELKLLLETGRVREVLDWTAESESESTLGPSALHWLRARALAALGDYSPAEEACARLAVLGEESQPPRQMLAMWIGQAILEEQPAPGGLLPELLWKAVFFPKFQNLTLSEAEALRQHANATVIHGLLFLEEGEVEEAEVAFRLALSLRKDEESVRNGSGLDFNGRPIAEGCLGWLEAARR